MPDIVFFKKPFRRLTAFKGRIVICLGILRLYLLGLVGANKNGCLYKIFLVHPYTHLIFNVGSAIEIKDRFRMGYFIKNTPPTPVSNRGILFLGENAKLIVDGSAQVGPGVRLHLSKNASLNIGDGTYILYDSTVSARTAIVIGKNVWIGENVSILKGVKIGNNCVIAAGSVVCKKLPANCIAAGVPAKPI